MVVSDIDLHLPRVFCAVAASGGFSNAQAIKPDFKPRSGFQNKGVIANIPGYLFSG